MTTEAIRLKQTKRAPRDQAQGEEIPPLRRSLQGVVASGLTVLATLALLSHDVASAASSNLIGPVGHHFAGGLLFLLGMPAFLLPLAGAMLALQLFRHRDVVPPTHVISGALALLLSSCLLLGLAGSAWSLTAYPSGGLLGMMLGDILGSFFGVAGASIIGATGAFAGAILVLGVRPVDAAVWLRAQVEEKGWAPGGGPTLDDDDDDETGARDDDRSSRRASVAGSTPSRAESQEDETCTSHEASDAPASPGWWRRTWKRWTDRSSEDDLSATYALDDEPGEADVAAHAGAESWTFGDEPSLDDEPAWAATSRKERIEHALDDDAPPPREATRIEASNVARPSIGDREEINVSSGTQMLVAASPRTRDEAMPAAPRGKQAPAASASEERSAASSTTGGADLHLWKRIKARFQEDEVDEENPSADAELLVADPSGEHAAIERWEVDDNDLVAAESVPSNGQPSQGAVALRQAGDAMSPPTPPAPPTPPGAGAAPSSAACTGVADHAGVPADFGPSIQPCASLLKPKAASDLDRAERESPLAKPEVPWEFPPLSFLSYKPRSTRIDHDALREQAARLEQVFADFKINGTVTNIRPGPVITMYEFEPEAGKRLTTIANLADNVKMALRAESVRIIAPLPGKGCVGIEVPNESRETVYLKEVLAHDTFRKNASPLVMGLGTDIEGNPVVADLAKMPHLLVAGTTGSGKSVAVNAMLTSILFRASPEDVKLILIDPKQLELAVYGDVPHLLLPVVTDPAKAATALNWAVNEMERRYTLMSEMRVRNLAGYNERVKELQGQFGAWIDPEIEPEALTPEERLLQQTEPDGRQRHRHMPYLVVVIDEFADLMMVAGKEVEVSVARLAQKARAAGIHVILATQRPSVDVLTGLIKANFPTRMSFRLISGTDSRTVLDSIGAENLLGMGDMLFRPPGATTLSRVHGAWLEEREIEQVVRFLRKQREPEFDESILDVPASDGGDGMIDDEPEDDRYGDAVEIVREAGFASISMIQRKLRIGYNRSARIVEQMEREGIVGPSSGGSGRREVLI